MPKAPMTRLPQRLRALALALCVVTTPLLADELAYRFHRQFTEDSALVTSVRDLVQDSVGFIWFIQRRTLHRYDGTDVITVAALPGRDAVTVLEADNEGNIWLGTNQGLQVWDRTTGTLEAWLPSTAGPFFRTRVTSLALDASGALWAGSFGGRVARIGPKGGEVELYAAADIDPVDPRPISVSTLLATATGPVWVGTVEGKLFRYTPGQPGFESVRLGEGQEVTAMAEGADGSIWVGTGDRDIFKVRPASLAVEELPARPDGAVTALVEDPQGHLWVGTETGVRILPPGDTELIAVAPDPEDPGEPGTDHIRALYLDRGGVVWISAGEGGVSTTSTGASAFTHWQPDASETSVRVAAIETTDDGSVWVGTYDTGLFRRRPSGEVQRFGQERSTDTDVGDTSIISLLADDDRRLWIGTLDSGISVMDLESETFVHYPPSPASETSLNNPTVSTLAHAADGRLLIGTFAGGLNVFDSATETFEAYSNRADDPTSLSENHVRSVLEDSQGRLWVGTRYQGLNLKLPGTSEFQRFRHDPDDPASLAHDTVMAIAEDSQGDVWLGTYRGLQRVLVNGDDVSFETFGPEQGLAGLKVLSVLEDAAGNLWLSTGQGISRFDRASRTFTNLARNHGLPPVGYNYNAYTQGPDGRIHYGSNLGLTSFDPASISLETYTPQIVLTGAHRFDQEVEVPPSSEGSERKLSFSHRDSLISFKFSLLDFNDSSRNRYEHFLEGFDEDWIDVGNHRRATYSNLPPGNYTFRVRGASSEGVWSAEDATLAVRILPPPWATWWAYGLYVLCAIGLVLAYARHQAAKQRREAQYTQRLEREVHRRTRELAEQNEKLRYANELLEVASVTDSLTGVRNRRFLLTTINQDIALVERALAANGDEARQDSAFVFILFDLDGFKEINDSYGHSAGDLVLFQVRDLLNQACRSSDTLIRWGGDEFLIVAREATRAHVEALAERIRQSVADHLFDIGTAQPVQLTCSLGFACYPFVASNPRLYSWEEVVDIADRALYVAKRHGPNMWAGIFGTEQTEETPAEDLLVMIMERPELLGAEGSIRLVTSRPTPTQAELHSTSGSKAS